MQDTEFHQQVLGLIKPWHVKAVKLEIALKQVTVEVACEDGAMWKDPDTSGALMCMGGSCGAVTAGKLGTFSDMAETVFSVVPCASALLKYCLER